MGWNENNIGDQTGKHVIITGANSGIGFETARALAAKGASLTLACRNAERAEQACQALKQLHPKAEVAVALMDLADLASVKAFADSYRDEHDSLDLLINNAGLMVPPFAKTTDGFELQFGCNHLGHFALTAQLIDHLTRSEHGRVVVVSSIAHKYGWIDFDNLNAEKGYKKTAAYGQSKLANLLFAYELQRRLQIARHKTRVVVAHPGYSATNLQRTMAFARLGNFLMAQSQSDGALPTLRAATDPDAAPASFWGPSGFLEFRGAPKQVQSNLRSHDEHVAARLWTRSEELTRVPFSLRDAISSEPRPARDD